MTAAARPVLVVAEQLDAAADMVVDQLNRRDVPLVRIDAADLPQQVTLTATHDGDRAGWDGVIDDGHRAVRLCDIRAVYWRRPGRPVIDPAVAEPYRTWAQNQADAALLNLLSALRAVPWINNPHHDRLASHKPQQLVAAVECGLRVPRSIVTNDPAAARAFAKQIDGPLVCKPILGGRLPSVDGGRPLMVPTHRVSVDALDDSIRTTAHLLQEQIPKAFEVRLIAVGDAVFGATIHAASDRAGTDWRTDPDHLTYGTIPVPQDIASACLRLISVHGLAFGAMDFAVTPAGEWVFFENNPAGTWAWVENHTGLPIAAAHADYLTQGVLL
ncbi:hypothetical protein DSC45_34265 [Streptomyces sp. YIM 130001]|uniref:ATP-grasp ribosomal peptide maturase n=1 Tax=Streptomyces sp. YIM 130001 TaxID=2259644 RepID=UPI000EC106D4|nr:ATP-grasp ribosomal peptide maturase [Streptomyces sp. YIM 130001]RII07982.1 hypothetical protein DSC45_34265 [Streptomyces sp. YIM 130001]